MICLPLLADTFGVALAHGSAIVQRFVMKTLQRVMTQDPSLATTIKAHEGVQASMAELMRESSTSVVGTLASTMASVFDA